MAVEVRGKSGGFSLIELMTVVVIIGLLAAVAMPAYGRYVRQARTVEAVEIVDKVTAGVRAFAMRDRTDEDGNLDPRFLPKSAESEPNCCESLGGECPGGHPIYDKPGWQEIGFSMPDNHRYRPEFRSDMFGAVLMVRGDQDCDGVMAMYWRMYGLPGNAAGGSGGDDDDDDDGGGNFFGGDGHYGEGHGGDGTTEGRPPKNIPGARSGDDLPVSGMFVLHGSE